MTKAYSRFLTALFALFLGGMLVWSLLLPDRERSEVENRTLAQWPAFSWQSLKDGGFTEGVEEYFAGCILWGTEVVHVLLTRTPGWLHKMNNMIVVCVGGARVAMAARCA